MLIEKAKTIANTAGILASKTYITGVLGFTAATATDLIGLNVTVSEKADKTDFLETKALVNLLETDLAA